MAPSATIDGATIVTAVRETLFLTLTGQAMTTLRQRADRLLVDRGLFESRAKAQAAIEAGLVTADERMVLKSSEQIPTDAKLHASTAHPYVSRGGVKLAAALDHFGFDPKDRICLDVGASTGGFTQVLLNRGARRIYAIDVGQGQLHKCFAYASRNRLDGRYRHPHSFPRRPRRASQSCQRRCQLHLAEVGTPLRRSGLPDLRPNWLH